MQRLNALLKIPENMLPNDIASLPHTDNDFDLEKVISEIRQPIQNEPLKLPAISELKLMLDIWKADGKKGIPHIALDNGTRHVNTQYLLDMMQAVPDCLAYAKGDSLASIYFWGKGGVEGILLPIRISGKNNKEAVM